MSNSDDTIVLLGAPVNYLRTFYGLSEELRENILVRNACREAYDGKLKTIKEIENYREHPTDQRSRLHTLVKEFGELDSDNPPKLDFIGIPFFAGGVLESVKLKANFTGGMISSSHQWNNVTASESTFVYTGIHPSKIFGGTFAGADMRGSKWINNEITGTDFTNAKLDGAEFNGVKFEGKKDGTFVSFRNVNLANTKFTGKCSFKNVDFIGATFGEETFSSANIEVDNSCIFGETPEADRAVRERLGFPKSSETKAANTETKTATTVAVPTPPEQPQGKIVTFPNNGAEGNGTKFPKQNEPARGSVSMLPIPGNVLANTLDLPQGVMEDEFVREAAAELLERHRDGTPKLLSIPGVSHIVKNKEPTADDIVADSIHHRTPQALYDILTSDDYTRPAKDVEDESPAEETPLKLDLINLHFKGKNPMLNQEDEANRNNIRNRHIRINATKSVFDNKEFDHCEFDGSTLVAATINKGCIRDSRLTSIDARAAQFNDVMLARNLFSQSLLDGSTFKDCELYNTHFQKGTSLSKSKFTEDTKLIQCQFDQTPLTNAWFHGTLINRCSFTDIHPNYNKDWGMKSATFTRAIIQDSTFKKCYMTDNRFNSSTLENVVFEDCPMGGTEFINTTFKNVDFRGATGLAAESFSCYCTLNEDCQFPPELEEALIKTGKLKRPEQQQEDQAKPEDPPSAEPSGPRPKAKRYGHMQNEDKKIPLIGPDCEKTLRKIQDDKGSPQSEVSDVEEGDKVVKLHSNKDKGEPPTHK